MGAILQLIICWVLASTHLTQLHGSPMRGTRVYGRDFLRIPFSKNKTENGRDTANEKYSRTRQDNSRIDLDIDDSSRSYTISQRAPNTHIPEEQRKLSVIRSSLYSRTLRLPWYKNSPLPVSSHTSQEAVRRRLHVKNQTLDTNKRYSTQNQSSGFDSFRQHSQNNTDSPRRFSLFARTFQQNSPLNHSLTRSEDASPMRHGFNSFHKKIDIISSPENSSQSSLPTRSSSQRQTLRRPMQKNQTTYTSIRKSVTDTTTFSPLTAEIVSQTEPTSTTEFFLYQLSEYDEYYYSTDDETQLSTVDDISVTNPHISQETVTEIITEANFSNYREKNESQHQIYSHKDNKFPVTFTTSTTEKNMPLYNKTIKLIPRRTYNNILPTSTTVQIPMTSTTPVVFNLFQTRRPTRPYKFTTPSISLRQRLLANRFKIRRNPSQKRSQLNNSNSQSSTNSELVIENLEKNNSKETLNISFSEQSISYSDTNPNTDPSYINITNSLNIHNNNKLSHVSRSPKAILNLFEPSTSQSHVDYSIEHASLPSLQLENPFEVNTPLETSFPYPSALHLLTDPLVVEINRGPIMKNQENSGKVEMSEQLTTANPEIKGIQEESSLVTNDDFLILTDSTAAPFTVLPSLGLINNKKSVQLINSNQKSIDIHKELALVTNDDFSILTDSTETPITDFTHQTFGSTIPNLELSTETTDTDTHFPFTYDYIFSNLTSSSTAPSTIIPITTQSSLKMKTKEETKASWEAQSRSLSTSAVRTEVRTTEHEVHVKIYEKLPTPPNAEISKMLESLERLKKQQGTAPFGSSPFGTNPAGTSSLGLVPQGQYPQGRNPLGLANLHQTPRPTESTTLSTTSTTSTTSSPNIRTGRVISEPNQSKFQLERKTKDGFIIGEYGVVDHDNGNVNGVRYTAEGNVDPKLIHDALQKFLSLK